MGSSTLLLLTIFISFTHAQYYVGHEYHRTPLGDAIDKTSLKFLKQAYQETADKNIIASPLGFLTLLSLYASATDGGLREEIEKALGSSNNSQVLSSYSELSREFSQFHPDFLTLANKIYVSDQYTLSEVFASLAVGLYQSEVETISFTDPPAATATINRWAEEKTNGHIKHPVPDDAITPDAVAGLFNIIFFQGHWNVPFEVKDTKDEDFHLNKTTTVKKPTMHLQRPLFYHGSRKLRAQFVELPYKENHFRMVVAVPDEIDGLAALVESVSNQGLLDEVFALEPSDVKIDLYIPKFEIESSLDLNELFPKIGISKIFQEPGRGLVKERGVIVSKAFQKAFVKIDEEGATAGAFTGSIFVPLSLHFTPPKPLEVRVDRPFLFLILYQDKIIFTGTYTR